MDYAEELLSIYGVFPFKSHPLWTSILAHELTGEQVLKAEIQHYLRTKLGQRLRVESAQKAPALGERILEAAVKNYVEEANPDQGQPTHLDLIRRLLLEGGVTSEELEGAEPTPGNTAAMAIYEDIADRGPACHLVGAGIVEHYYAELAPQIFEAYTSHYGMTPQQAETYGIHGSVDAVHAYRALGILDEAIEVAGWPLIKRSVMDAVIATSLHYDGMLQAAVGKNSYWDGVSR